RPGGGGPPEAQPAPAPGRRHPRGGRDRSLGGGLVGAAEAGVDAHWRTFRSTDTSYAPAVLIRPPGAGPTPGRRGGRTARRSGAGVTAGTRREPGSRRGPGPGG